LSDADIQVLTNELGNVDSQMKDQVSRINAAREVARIQANAGTWKALVDADRELDTVTRAAYSKILLMLSREGATALREHLTYIKSKIKVIPPPQM